MDKETLSNYGWIVICVLVLAVMIALATPFGRFIEQAVQNTAQGLFDVNQNALDVAGINIGNQYIDQTNDANILYDKVYCDIHGSAGIWHRDGSITLYNTAVDMTFFIAAEDVLIEGNIVSHTDPVCPTQRQYYTVNWDGLTIQANTYYYSNYDSASGVYLSRTDRGVSPVTATEFTTIESWLEAQN